jgi:hypothetical protein
MTKDYADTASRVDKVAWQHNNAKLDMRHSVLDVDNGTSKHGGDI